MPTPAPSPLKEVTRTPSHYRAEDSADDRFYIDAKLNGGVLTFEIVAELPGGIRGSLSGKQLFAVMVQHFGAVNIQKLKAIWADVPGLDTNLRQFNQLTDPQQGGLSEEDAARRTWTGQRATVDLRLVQVQIQMLLPPVPGQYEDVIALFSR